MTERTPEFSMEVPGLRVEVFLEEGSMLDEREQTMQQILNFVDQGQYTEAQELVTSSGIKYSEAAEHFRQSEGAKIFTK